MITVCALSVFALLAGWWGLYTLLYRDVTKRIDSRGGRKILLG